MELYRRLRPKTLDEMFGQPDAVRTLARFVKAGNVPHALLITGPSGVGKTTAARIVARELSVSKTDYYERNVADTRGIDTVREIRTNMRYAAMGGKCRVYTLDEAQQLTKDAQNALLKMLEDPPDHVYFMLCTTDPQKLLATVRNRCTEIRMVPLPAADVSRLCVACAEREGVKLDKRVADKIAEAADGSARAALVTLERVMGEKTVTEQLDAVAKTEVRRAAIELARTLMQRGTRWPDVAKILRELDGEEPEGLRRMILGYARKVLLGGGPDSARTFAIIQAFRDHVYDSGHAGLAAAAYEVFGGK